MKSTDSILMAIEHFNRPWDRGRQEIVLVLLDRSFELLLKSIIVHKGGQIRERGRNKTAGFDTCVRKCVSDAQVKCLSEEEALNIQIINSFRDAAQHYVVDISEQQLNAYEGDALVYSFKASTGIASSPTIPGVFQILSKEEEAYASSWDLWMPHFMGIYRTGPDFTNGIHGLPTLSSGTRLWEGYLGSPISYGCVVVGLNEAAQLYKWTELGTLVVIQE